MDQHSEQCMTEAERQQVRESIPNNAIKSFLALNQATGGQMACATCVAYLQSIVKARTMRHEAN
jgi:bacterioferritin-associated ferredoxin